MMRPVGPDAEVKRGTGVVRTGGRRRGAERDAAQKCFTIPLFECKNLQKIE
jgi:hypothetical protein